MIVRSSEDEAKLRIRPSVLKSVHAHARESAPRECCGALLGSGGKVVDVIELPNEASRPGIRYRVGPDRFREAEAEASDRGLSVVGFYHSHPAGQAAPSPLDARAAWPWYVYLIKGMDGIRAFRLLEDRSAFAELRITPAPDAERMVS